MWKLIINRKEMGSGEKLMGQGNWILGFLTLLFQ
jgi:hypothetical protein